MIVASMYLLYKNTGETCLEALGRLKSHLGGGFEASSFTYAGRLDPLARGLLIVLKDEEIVKKTTYLDLKKTYEFEVVFGVCTDSFDQLGVIYPSDTFLTWHTLNSHQEIVNSGSTKQNLKTIFEKISNNQGLIESDRIIKKDFIEALQVYIKDIIGTFTLSYPFFSSKPVDGVPLFQYSKDHSLDEVNLKLPTQEVVLENISCLDIRFIPKSKICDESINFAQKIKGDFRQNEIISSWENEKTDTVGIKEENPEPVYMSIKFEIECSSGFYVRSLACWLGQIFGTGAIAYDIFRTKVGDYVVDEESGIKFVE